MRHHHFPKSPSRRVPPCAIQVANAPRNAEPSHWLVHRLEKGIIAGHHPEVWEGTKKSHRYALEFIERVASVNIVGELQLDGRVAVIRLREESERCLSVVVRGLCRVRG